MNLNPTTVAIVAGFLIPLAVGLLTKVSAPDRVKAVAGIVLAAVAALITQATTADGGAVISQEMVVTWALALGTSIASYLGVWKPVANINDHLLPDKGIG
jgi:carbon starvation protein CstA